MRLLREILRTRSFPMRRLLPAVLLSLVSFAAFAKDRPGAVTLTLLHINDGESILLDAGKGLEEFGGASRFTTVVERLRTEAAAQSDGTLLVSAGDNYEPGPS